MSRSNPVTQVLITRGNQAVLGNGLSPSALAPGQIGVFDAFTGLSVAAGTTARNLYLAVGQGTLGGTLTDIKRSAGQVIQKENILSLSLRCYTPAQNKIVDITGYTVKCDTDYMIKIGVSNGAAYSHFGYDTPSKTFSVHSNCCTDDCAVCPEGDTNDVTKRLADSILADVDKMFTVNFLATSRAITITGPASATGTFKFKLDGTEYSVAVTNGDTATVVAAAMAAAINNLSNTQFFASNSGAVLTVKSFVTGAPIAYATTGPVAGVGTAGPMADTVTTQVNYANYATYTAANPGVNLGLRIEAKPDAVAIFATLNRKYDFIRGTNINIYLVEGFNCNGTVTTFQELGYELGAGYDLAEKENYHAGHNGAGNYRLSANLGMEIGTNLTPEADKSGKYLTAALSYLQESVSGWGEYKNALLTIIGIPCGETTTISSFFTVMDAISGRDAITDDAAACPSCTTINFTADASSLAVDGLTDNDEG